LRDVVVRIRRRDDDDRKRRIRRPQLFEQLEAAAIAELEVEQDDVVAGVLGEELAGSTCRLAQATLTSSPNPLMTIFSPERMSG